MKKLFILFSVLMIVFSVFTVTASAESVTPDIEPPLYQSWEKMQGDLPQTYSDISLDRHFVFFSDSETYDKTNGGFDFVGKAKVYAFAFNSQNVKDFELGSNYSYVHWDSYEGRKANVYVYSYDFTHRKWVYEKTHTPNSNNIFLDFGGEHLVLYSDFEVKVGNVGVKYDAFKLSHITEPSWQSLTWKELGSIPSTMVSEILGILPVVLTFAMMSIAIHKGVSFIFNFLRNA